MAPAGEVVNLLTRAGQGDSVAAAELAPQIYESLRGLAKRYMAGEPSGHTLQATALVHEAYLRLIGDGPTDWNGKGHFYGAAAQAMRRILVERARRKGRIKHGGEHRHVSASALEITEHGASDADAVDFIALDEALNLLQVQDPRAAQIVMLRYFAGLGVNDVAHVLDISDRTVRREWNVARLWLYEKMSSDQGDTSDGHVTDDA